MALSDKLADDVGSDEGVRAGDECVWHIEDDGFKEPTRVIRLMIALRKLKDLENVCLFDGVLVRMDFDSRLMNCRYSGEEERPLSQRQQAFMHFSTGAQAREALGAAHRRCIMGVELCKPLLHISAIPR